MKIVKVLPLSERVRYIRRIQGLKLWSGDSGMFLSFKVSVLKVKILKESLTFNKYYVPRIRIDFKKSIDRVIRATHARVEF